MYVGMRARGLHSIGGAEGRQGKEVKDVIVL